MMRAIFWLVAGALLLGIVGSAYFVVGGVSARTMPPAIEVSLAHAIRNTSLAMHTGGLTNPMPTATPEMIKEGMAHFADHCAVCHGTDGGGDTEMGRGLYPRPPDMRLPATQNLSDAELYSIIENGVRLTGMPGWGNGTKEGEMSSWHLISFIRHLPKMTDEEVAQMDDLIPRTPAGMQQREEEKKFLSGAN